MTVPDFEQQIGEAIDTITDRICNGEPPDAAIEDVAATHSLPSNHPVELIKFLRFKGTELPEDSVFERAQSYDTDHEGQAFLQGLASRMLEKHLQNHFSDTDR